MGQSPLKEGHRQKEAAYSSSWFYRRLELPSDMLGNATGRVLRLDLDIPG